MYNTIQYNANLYSAVSRKRIGGACIPHLQLMYAYSNRHNRTANALVQSEFYQVHQTAQSQKEG